MTIETELLNLKNDEDLIIPEEAVKWAKSNPGSALHGALDWDDAHAAAQHRIWQVRRLIAIHIVSDEGVRQVVSLSIDRGRVGGGYRSIDDVMPIPRLRDMLFDDAMKELTRVQEKYDKLTEFAKVWAEIRAVKRRRKVRSTPAQQAAVS